MYFEYCFFSIVYCEVLISYIRMMMNFIIYLFIFDLIIRNKEIFRLTWPIRFYVIDQMKNLYYIVQPIDGSYPLESIKNSLDQVIQQYE
jgi:hypothetical protein